jgi:hypothetical protein
MEQRPGLKRLLETTHLELNGKLFVNTQQVPYLARQLSAFRPRGVPRPTSKIVAVCPSPDGLARDGTQGGKPRLVLSCARGGAVAVGVTSVREGEREREREREREPVRQPVLPRDHPPV